MFTDASFNMTFYQPGQEIGTEVVAVTNDTIFLDLNAKSEGVLDKAELVDKDGNCSVKEGDGETYNTFAA